MISLVRVCKVCWGTVHVKRDPANWEKVRTFSRLVSQEMKNKGRRNKVVQTLFKMPNNPLLVLFTLISGLESVSVFSVCAERLLSVGARGRSWGCGRGLTPSFPGFPPPWTDGGDRAMTQPRHVFSQAEGDKQHVVVIPAFLTMRICCNSLAN